MKNFLCQEGTEQFTMEAPSRAEAEQAAQIYNAVVIKELKPKLPKKESKQ